MQRTIRFRSLALFTIIGATAIAGAQLQYRVTELPPLPGYSVSNGFSINDLGDVVGESRFDSRNTTMATIWHAGVPKALGKVAKGNDSSAWAINNSGVIAGEGDDGDFRPNAVTFQKSVATFIDAGANNSHAIFVQNSGAIVGNYLKGFGGADAWNPAIWTEDKPGRYKHTFLPHFIDPTGGISSVYANGANNTGIVVGQVSSTLWSARGGFWNNDSKHTLSLLDPLPGEWDSYALGVNDKGAVVGVSDLGSFSMTPVIWASGTHAVSALPLLPGEIYGSARDINNLGQVIGAHGSDSAPAVWIDGKLIDVQSALDASGAGWTISVLYKINGSGQIVGVGSHNGAGRAFILTPISATP